MIDRLYNAYCHWKAKGTRELLILTLLTLKNKGAPVTLTPGAVTATHTLRTKPTGQELVKTKFQHCSALRLFSTPGNGAQRISIVTDSINSGSLYGGVGTAMIFAAMLAEATKARLRIITRTERAQPSNLEHVLTTYGIHVAEDVEFVFAPFNDDRYEIDFFYGECFITTSWWTTASTMASVPHESIIYLLQEDERMFYPYGDDHLRCTAVLAADSLRFVINTRLLFDHFKAEGFSNIAANGTWFEPAFPSEVFYPRPEQRSGKRTLMFYARPNNLRNLFYFGVELLEEAVSRGIIDLSQWDILLVGKDVPKITIGETYVPEVMENMAWAEYAELIGRVQLGLCLMYTPHPSYPPLDLAASGAVVVTNRFAGKQDLSMYSNNIVCGNLCKESMLQALAAGVALAADEAACSANYKANGLNRNWRACTAAVIQALAGSN